MEVRGGGVKKHKPTFGIRFFLKVSAHVSLSGGPAIPSSHTMIVFYDMARLFVMNTHSFYLGTHPTARGSTGDQATARLRTLQQDVNK